MYSIVPAEVPLATKVAEPCDFVVTSDGLESTVAADEDSRKSNTPLPSRSAGIPVYVVELFIE